MQMPVAIFQKPKKHSLTLNTNVVSPTTRMNTSTHRQCTTMLRPDWTSLEERNNQPEKKLRDWRSMYQNSRLSTTMPSRPEKTRLHSSRTPLMLMSSHTTQLRAHHLPQRNLHQLKEKVMLQVMPQDQVTDQVTDQVLP